MRDDKELESLLPVMNVNLPQPKQEEEKVISDAALVGMYAEIMDNVRKDRLEIDGLIQNFADMVINEGDSTSASKEALVNLIKIKSDTADKMTKIADLMTRVNMKERNTFPGYLAAHQNNTIKISDNGMKRELLKQVSKLQKKEENAEHNKS